jgi:hypothetical protein
MPRLGLHVFAPTLCPEAFPIKASDDPLGRARHIKQFYVNLTGADLSIGT